MIHLDFETRSRADIWGVGAYAYAAHPSTEILCLAYAVDGAEVKLIEGEDIPMLGLIDHEAIDFLQDRAMCDPGDEFVAHNSFFEYCIWHQIMVKRYGWPSIPLRRWRCTASQAAAFALPRALAKACDAMDSPHKKDMAGKRVMLKLCKPRRPTKADPNEWYEKDKYQTDYDKLYEYCIDDVKAERSLDKLIPKLNPTEREVWLLDQTLNLRGVMIDREAVNAALCLIAKYNAREIKKVEVLSDGHLDGVSKRLRVMNWIKSKGVEIDSYTKDSIGRMLKEEDLPDEVREVLETRLELGQTSVKKYDALANAMGCDDRIRDILMYHGATTGRWTGKLVQLQNLPKGTIKDPETCIEILKYKDLEFFEMFYPSVLKALSGCIRGMIIAPEGHDLIVADYNAIEARVVMWLAGEEVGLDKFRKGEDIYVQMASRIYNKDDITKEERALGKTAILGCGYQMGSSRFHDTCTSFGLAISEELAKKSVRMYRETYRRVRSMWSDQEAAAIKTVETKKDQLCGVIKYGIRRGFLLCRLPSGRYLAYKNPSLEWIDTSWGERKLTLTYMGMSQSAERSSGAWERQKTYGGKLVENITQAVARDIMAEAMLRCESKDYRVTFSVHDEIVCEIPKGFGSLAEYIKLLEQPPDWAKDCPIKAEGWRGERYKK